LGLSREYQETARRLVELGQQFQQRYTEFAQQNATVMQDAFHVMKKRVDARLPPKSPAELYDAWIDCAEDAYHQAAHSDSFARLLADLCNISSAMKVERGKLTEQLARHLDLPSRAEVDSLHRQVRALTAALHRPAPAAAPAPAKPAKSAKAARTARPTQNPRAVRTPRKRAKK
jgi:class III poly(R)-hydroxyalkanoic acid synthase PhaE subunit